MEITIKLNKQEIELLHDSLDYLFFIGGNKTFIAENREEIEKIKNNLRILKNIDN